jgi:hypothetical protein
VCIDPSGNDNGTLVNELNAYRDRDADFYSLFFDCMGPFAESFGLPRSPHIGLLAYPSKRLLSKLPVGAHKDARRGFEKAASSDAPLAITLGCVLANVEIDGVLDLRLAGAQQWLFATYVPAGPFPTDATDFLGILPELTKQDLGSWSENNRRTHAIGADLRRRRVSALIFPSARSNVYVTTDQGQITNWGGWNLVRYSRSPSLRSFIHHDDGGWLTKFPFSRIAVRRKVNESGEEVGWEIDGLMDVNMRAGLGNLDRTIGGVSA